MSDSPGDARSDPRNAHLPLMNQPHTILGTTITFLTLAVIAASLRLWSRFRDRLWGTDDSFVVLACIASIAGDCLVCLLTSNGLGLHFYTLSTSEQEAYFKYIWSSNSAYCASTTLIKLAILSQYLRLFAETTASTTSAQYRLARRCIWTSIIIIAMWGFTFFMLALFPCRPIAKKWKPSLEGKCVGWGSKDPNESFRMWAAHGATNMFLDIVVLLLPMPFVGMFRIAGKSRKGLLALFAIGTVVAGVSVGRTVSLCIKRLGTIPIPDMSYYTPLVYIFSVLEVNLAILCASIPIFWPMISSLAANKILVVNEIVVHVEDYPKGSIDGQDGIGLASQAAFKSPPGSPTPQPSARLVARPFDRTRDTTARAAHSSRASIASSMTKSTRAGPSHRSSQESQRNLCKLPTRDTGGLTRSDIDWFADLDRESAGKRTTTRIETGNPFQSPETSPKTAPKPLQR